MKYESGGRRQGRRMQQSASLWETIQQMKDGQKLLICGVDRDIVLTASITERQGIRGMEFDSVIINETVDKDGKPITCP